MVLFTVVLKGNSHNLMKATAKRRRSKKQIEEEKLQAEKEAREIQKKVAENDPYGTWIKTCDLNDGYHYDSSSHITIGRRAGKALLPFIRKTVPQKLENVQAARKQFFAQFAKPGSPDTKTLANGLMGYPTQLT